MQALPMISLSLFLHSIPGIQRHRLHYLSRGSQFPYDCTSMFYGFADCFVTCLLVLVSSAKRFFLEFERLTTAQYWAILQKVATLSQLLLEFEKTYSSTSGDSPDCGTFLAPAPGVWGDWHSTIPGEAFLTVAILSHIGSKASLQKYRFELRDKRCKCREN